MIGSPERRDRGTRTQHPRRGGHCSPQPTRATMSSFSLTFCCPPVLSILPVPRQATSNHGGEGERRLPAPPL